MRPTDGSAVGGFFQLSNGNKALGFRASLEWCRNDALFRISDETAIRNYQGAAELKLQCTLPISARSKIALGIAPSIITSTRMVLEFRNKSNGTIYGEQHTLQTTDGELNELNSSLCISWFYQIRGRFSIGLHADQDMLKLYDQNIAIKQLEGTDDRTFNFRRTFVSASMIFHLKY